MIIKDNISIYDKLLFIKDVAESVVSDDIGGYMPILEDIAYKYALINYFTDIVLFENEEFSISKVELYIRENQSMVDEIKQAIDPDDELLNYCKQAIDFRKSHFSDFRQEVSDLLSVVRELVIKPNPLSELADALLELVNGFKDKEIDLQIVDKLNNILPMLDRLSSADIAKAIIDNSDKVVSIKNNKQ